jgi:ABC-2 type transport system permease protein
MELTPTLRRLWKLSWLELKVFVREPLGFVGSIGVPVVLSLAIAGVSRPGIGAGMPGGGTGQGLPAFSPVVTAMSAVISLVTIISIYREGGILKRLRATPLGPVVILSAHVMVKIAMTAATLVIIAVVGRPFYSAGPMFSFLSFSAAILFTTWSILSIGFVIASVVPTARLAQLFAALLLYPQVAMSGVFYPLDLMPPPVASLVRKMPMTAAASLLDGIWRGEGWAAHGSEVTTLVITFVLSAAVSSKIFRWE